MNNLYFDFLRVILITIYFYFILRKNKNKKLSKLGSVVISTLLWVGYYLESLTPGNSVIKSTIIVLLTIIWLTNSLVMISQLEKSK